MNLRRIIPIAFLAGLAAATASAEVEVKLEVKEAQAVDAKAKGKAPFVEATIIGGPGGVPATDFTLVQTDAKTPVSLRAVSLRKFSEGSETIAIVLLVEGHELWMGNETYVESEDDKYVGVFTKLVTALDPLSKSGPPGSKGALVVYSTGAELKQGMGDLAALTGDKLGTQRDYSGKVNRDLVAGLNLALAELTKVTASRKALIIVGDGADTNAESARAQIAELKNKLEANRIETYGLYFANSDEPSMEGDPGQLKSLTTGSQYKSAQSMESIGPSLSAIIEQVQNRYYVLFPGFDPKLKSGLTWDGREHELAIKIGQEEPLEAQTLVLSPTWHPSTAGGLWWLWLILAVVVIIAVGVIIKVKTKAPPPVVMEAPPPAPAGPLKTVMIGIGGDDQGWPVVGWVVPLNGPNQYQTFKLLGGATKIGTGGGAHVVINDGFMSTEHAQIVTSPQGFVLQDNQSTNGSFVNEKRVDKHDLVDNDVITLGKTNFKFKSIN